MKRMMDMVNGKTLGIMLHGSSIATLDKRIHEFKDKDWVWVSVNMFNMMESHILSKITKHLSIVQCGGRVEIQRRIPHIIEFLYRKDDNMFITTIKALGYLTQIQYDTILCKRNKIYVAPYYEEVPVPNSLSMLIDIFTKASPKRLVLFGSDGYPINHGDDARGKGVMKKLQLDSYYSPFVDQYFADKTRRGVAVGRDTAVFNERYENFKTDIPILNCSMESYVKPFIKITYDEAVKLD